MLLLYTLPKARRPVSHSSAASRPCSLIIATACSWKAPLVGTKPTLPCHSGPAKSRTDFGRSFSAISFGLKATTRVRAVTPIQSPLAPT
ncbi:hypothetical protein PS706_05909 [Pseudomonas fluorescens]|nr:hypothetical protein PS706_05879 [Pseudomonas fluorescens]VVO41240.1 hypothetical protein PS706_05909 [Pseudomonas fluorescens]